VNGESVNETLLAEVPVSPKTDFNNLSSSGFPFDCSMLKPGSYCGYCRHARGGDPKIPGIVKKIYSK
jgi:hypothetical protein